MNDFQKLTQILRDVWDAAVISGDNDTQRELTLTAKFNEIVQLAERRGLAMENGKFTVCHWALDLFLAGIETGKKFREETNATS